jgi:hypothetical protein
MLPANGAGGGSDVWMVATKGDIAPRILVRNAHSPVRIE